MQLTTTKNQNLSLAETETGMQKLLIRLKQAGIGNNRHEGLLLTDEGHVPCYLRGDKITPEQKEVLEFSLKKLNSSTFDERIDFDDKDQAAKVHGWLISLGMVVAGTLSSNELAAKANAYRTLFKLEFKDKYFPLELFSDENLLKAAKKFKFFPTYEEISEFFSANPTVSLQGSLKWVIRHWLECPVSEPKQIAENPEVADQIKELMAGMFNKVPEEVTR